MIQRCTVQRLSLLLAIAGLVSCVTNIVVPPDGGATGFKIQDFQTHASGMKMDVSNRTQETQRLRTETEQLGRQIDQLQKSL